MHDIQFNTTQDMNAYPFTLTPPSSNEDSPQAVNMHSPNHYLYQSHHNVSPPHQYIVPPGHQYDIPMTGLFATELKPPYLALVEQPVDKFRFRYKSEMAGTHGSLAGSNSDKTRKQTYPTVKLHNFYEHEAIIRCSIYQQGSSDDRQPHAHRLIMKHGHEERDDPHDILVTKDHNYEASFHSMGIIHTAKKHIVSEIKRKKSQLKKEDIARHEKQFRALTIKEEVEINNIADELSKSINLNIVCLRFDAFRKENNILYPICKPIYSHTINNLKSALTGELKIVRMDHSSSPAKGNREIFMLVEKVTKKNIKIRFFELDEEDNEIWSEYGKFNDLDVHHQYAIVFRTPAYKDLNIEEPRKVFIELERPSDGSRSEPREFTYTSGMNYKPGVKRPRTMYPSSEYSSSALSSAELPTTLEALQNPTYEVNSAELQAALSNINSDEFQKLFDNNIESFIALNSKTNFSLDFTSKDNCTMDSQKNTKSSKPDAPSPNRDKSIMQRVYEEFEDFLKSKPKTEDVIGMLNHLFTKHENDMHENALHIAISEGNIKLLRYFFNILNIYKQYQIFNMTNANGETALHLALHHQLGIDVVTMLVKYQSDVTLGDSNGNTPLHIAIMKGQSNVIIDALLRSPLDSRSFVNTENKDSLTALHMAIKMNKPRYVDLLYKHGADVNLIDKKTGRNSLHIAITEKAVEIVKFLLDKTNIDILKEDFGGFSPLKMAKHLMQDKEHERIEIFEIIEKTLMDRGLNLECIIKEEVESEEEMELEMVECKIEKLSIEEIEPLYKKINTLTPACLERVCEILDGSGNWFELAKLLDLEYFVHTDMFMNSKSKSKKLLQFGLKNHTLFEIRNFLNNLGEIEAVSVMDTMVMSMRMET